MQTLSEIKALLAERGVRPSHRLGQNFLHDHNQLTKILDAADIKSGDLVLEVGPGTGTLTEALLDCGAEVIASELDATMASIVRERVGERVHLIEGDCLARDRTLAPALIDALGQRTFKLVANLPYQAATPLMIDLLVRRPHCSHQVALMQREVVDRLLAPEGGREYGPISVLTALFSHAHRVSIVPPGCFWPQPKVTSAVIHLQRNVAPPIDDAEAFADFLGDLFRSRRKQLGTILGRANIPADIDPTLRPEALSPNRLLALFQAGITPHE